MAEIVTIIGLCSSIAHGALTLNGLLDKFRGASDAIESLSVQTQAIGAGVTDVKNSLDGKNNENRLDLSDATEKAMRRCLEAMTKEIKTLQKYMAGLTVRDGRMHSLDKAKHIWNEATVAARENNLIKQMRTTSFLLHIVVVRRLSVVEQKVVITKAEGLSDYGLEDLAKSRMQPVKTDKSTKPTSPSTDKATDTEHLQTMLDAGLWNAVRSGSVSQINACINAKADVNSTTANIDRKVGGDFKPLTALAIAVMAGQLNSVTTLLERGANVNPALQSSFRSPLHHACRANQPAIAKVLLSAGANVKAVDDAGCLPMQYAIYTGSCECVDLLLQNHADVSKVRTKGSTTGIHLAASHGHANVFQRLIDAGADINSEFANKRQPLHSAAVDGHREIVAMALKAGARANHVDRSGRTALHSASFRGHATVVGLLLDADAPLDAADKNGDSPLHEAAYNGHLKVVKLLVKKGADVAIKNKNGKPPADFAAEKGKAKVVDFLLNKEVESFSNVRRQDLEKRLAKEMKTFREDRERQLSSAASSKGKVAAPKNQTPLQDPREPSKQSPKSSPTITKSSQHAGTTTGTQGAAKKSKETTQDGEIRSKGTNNKDGRKSRAPTPEAKQEDKKKAGQEPQEMLNVPKPSGRARSSSPELTSKVDAKPSKRNHRVERKDQEPQGDLEVPSPSRTNRTPSPDQRPESRTGREHHKDRAKTPDSKPTNTKHS